MTKRRNFTPEFKAEVVLEALSGETSQAELCRRHNLSEQQLSKWKQQVVENVATLFVSSTDQQSSEAAERIAHLEQLVGRLTVALDIEKKAATWVELTSSEKREMVETVRNTSSYSVRQICQTLGFNRSLVYSHSKSDPSQRELREKIEALCLEYPKYGYRRIKALLLRQGYTVGTRRVARVDERSEPLGCRQTCVSNDPFHGASTALAESSEDPGYLSLRSGLGRRYYLRPPERTFHLCRSAHGCLHPHDKRVAAESALDAKL